MTKIDPIRVHFERAALIEKFVTLAFISGCILSIALLVVQDKAYPKLSDILQTLFIVVSVSIFVVGNISRLFMQAYAEESRVGDFCGRAFSVGISANETSGYYNDGETQPFKRIASQLLEDLLFTKNVSAVAVKPVRGWTVAYLVLWLCLLVWRDVRLDYISIFSQAIFSEEILSKWIRLEWLRYRSEHLYEDVYKIIKTKPTGAVFSASILEKFTIYERVKATAAVILPDAVFEKINPSLSARWEEIKKEVGIRA